MANDTITAYIRSNVNAEIYKDDLVRIFHGIGDDSPRLTISGKDENESANGYFRYIVTILEPGVLSAIGYIGLGGRDLWGDDYSPFELFDHLANSQRLNNQAIDALERGLLFERFASMTQDELDRYRKISHRVWLLPREDGLIHEEDTKDFKDFGSLLAASRARVTG